jgi:hypothetical protein
MQPNFDHLEVRFGEDAFGMQAYFIAGTPHFIAVRMTEVIEGISDTLQSRDR